MAGLSFLNRIRRQWAQLHGQGPSLGGAVRLYSPPEVSERDSTAGGEIFDRSYDDALLDMELRRFLRGEFGEVEPPEGSFQMLVRRVHLAERNTATVTHATPKRPGVLWNSTAATRQVLFSRGAMRLLSGGIAVTVLAFVLGSNASQLHNLDVQADYTAVSTLPTKGAPTALARPQPDTSTEPPEHLTPAWAYTNRTTSTFTYDPAELGKPQRRNTTGEKEEWEQRVERTRIGNEF